MQKKKYKMIILNGVICMYSFVLGVIFTLGVGGALYLAYLVGKKSTATKELPIEVLDEAMRRKQELQEQQIDDFSKMMSYDVEIAYDRRNEV